VVRAHDDETVRRIDDDTVPEFRTLRDAERFGDRGVGNRPETHDDARRGQGRKFAPQERQAPCPLVRCRRVVGWHAANGERHPRAGELETVVVVARRRLVGETRTMHGAVQPVAAAIAGEHATRAVRAVRTWRESDDDDACVGITEPGDGFAPVRLVGVGGTLRARNIGAPLDESRTCGAFHHRTLHRTQFTYRIDVGHGETLGRRQ